MLYEHTAYPLTHLEPPMPNPNSLITIFWGDNFDEVPTAIFIRELRQTGTPMTVIGFSERPAYGRNGMSITTDVSLEQALSLAYEIKCVILPCAAVGGQRLKCDPRLPQFFHQVATNQATFVIGDMPEADIEALGLAAIPAERVLRYPSQSEALVQFTHQLVRRLSKECR